MAKNTEFRVAVGGFGQPRSTVWKFFTRNNDAYITGRMFGRDAKVTFHGSGDCHCGLTGDWVRRTNARNRDRHFEQWSIVRPTGTEASLIFEILIPTSELAVVAPEEPDLEHGVFWIPNPGSDLGVVLGCHMTPPIPRSALELPADALCCLPMQDDRHFVVRASGIGMIPAAFSELRSEVIRALERDGLSVRPGNRITAHRAGPIRGFIEMAAFPEPTRG